MSESMLFEHTMKLFLGDKTDGIESFANNLKELNKWLKKTAEKMMERIETIETSEKHKQILMQNLANILQKLSDNRDTSQDMFYHLLQFCGQLLGFSYFTGGIYKNLFYFQDEDQYYASVHYDGRDSDREKVNDKKMLYQCEQIWLSN